MRLRVWAVSLGTMAVMVACSRAPVEDGAPAKPQVFTDRNLDALVGRDGGVVPGHRALGAACGGARGRECASGICLKSQRARGQGSFCSRECVTQDDCPQDWLCRQVMPGPRGMLCTPPARWTAHAVGVRR